ncbi:MAG TPA: TlpA disulfide reductase family protein [Vicinamibacterales bacterium]|nr:TlpA disulfide reductase family protein [Vicinamibacterales bacterium]
MDQPNSKLRLAAIAATAIALLAISVPFIFEGHLEAEPAAAETMTPVASHELPALSADAQGGACMANAKPANLDFTMPDLNGKDVSLSSFKGKVILLNFWATWCGPCKAEIPGFVELQNQYGKDGLVIVGYSVDDDAPKAQAFADQFKMNYPVLLGLGREDVQDAYGPIWGIPASFIISRDGRVCQKHLGIAPKAVFEKEIKALL